MWKLFILKFFTFPSSLSRCLLNSHLGTFSSSVRRKSVPFLYLTSLQHLWFISFISLENLAHLNSSQSILFNFEFYFPAHKQAKISLLCPREPLLPSAFLAPSSSLSYLFNVHLRFHLLYFPQPSASQYLLLLVFFLLVLHLPSLQSQLFPQFELWHLCMTPKLNPESQSSKPVSNLTTILQNNCFTNEQNKKGFIQVWSIIK